MKQIIAFTGKAGSGKDTAADYLVEKHGFQKIAFATPIREVVKEVFSLTHEQVYDRVHKDTPLEDFPDWTVRKLLQIVGTEFFRNHIDKDVWVKALIRKIKNSDHNKFAITDMRFPNEYDLVMSYKESNPYVVKIKRDGCDGVVGLQQHESEAYDLESDIEISNDGNVKDLHSQIQSILDEHLYMTL